MNRENDMVYSATPQALMIQLGQRIRVVRQRSGMTQEELAAALSLRAHTPISRSTLGNYETGRRPLPADLLLQIADICGVPLQAFALSEKQSPNHHLPTETAFQDAHRQESVSLPDGPSAQALALITTTLQERPDIIPFVLELIAGFVEEPLQS